MISGIIDVEICASISQKVKVLPSFSARARGVDAQVLGATMFGAGTLPDPPSLLPPPLS